MSEYLYRLNVKKLLSILSKHTYVYETVSGWTVKRYGDGTYEAWRDYTATSLTLTSASAGTYYSSSSYKVISLPYDKGCDFAIGMETQPQGSGVYIYQIVRHDGDITVYYRAHASTSNGQCAGQFYVKGKWLNPLR